jgi:hypothetical protein
MSLTLRGHHDTLRDDGVKQVEECVVLLRGSHARRPTHLHRPAYLAQCLHGCSDHVPDVGRHGAEGIVQDETDAVLGQTGPAGRGQRPAVGGRVLGVWTPQDFEGCLEIAGTARLHQASAATGILRCLMDLDLPLPSRSVRPRYSINTSLTWRRGVGTTSGP